MPSPSVSNTRRVTALSGLLFSALLVSAFALVFGPSVMAQFMRQDGPAGWGYGYGYGYGVGYGWDEGDTAGLMTDPDLVSSGFSIRNVIDVATGLDHSVALMSDGSVYAWGRNSEGQLGDGTTTQRANPIRVHGAGDVGSLTNIVAIAAGGFHSLALTSGGEVYAWGFNGDGSLGNGENTNRTTPIQVHGVGDVGFLTGIDAIASGRSHSLALANDGTVYAWGYNGEGALGDGTNTSTTTPVQVHGVGDVGFLSGIDAIASGVSYHSLALANDGTVYAWGRNTNGHLGDSTTTQRDVPVQVHGVGDVGFLSDITAIATGADHSLALTSGGAVYAWGFNSNGQLGDATTTQRTTPVQVHGVGDVGFLSDIYAITGAGAHSLVRTSSGVVYAWGANGNGQLGDGTSTESTTPVQVHGVGDVGFLTGIEAVAGGNTFSLVLASDDTVYGWGAGGSGQLGDGLTTQSLTPVATVEADSTPPVTAFGHGYGWGYGLPDHEDAALIAYDPATDTYDVDALSVGYLHVVSAVLIPVYDETDPTIADQWYFNANVRVHTDNGDVWTIPKYTVVDPNGDSLYTLQATSVFNTDDIPGEIRAVLFTGLAGGGVVPSFNLNDLDNPMTIAFAVDEGLEGDELDVWYLNGLGAWALDDQTCEVEEAVCTITTPDFTGYAVVGGSISTGGSTTIAPYTTLSLPNGGQSLIGGQTYDILWNAGGTGVSQIRLSLSTDSGTTFPTTITTLTSNPGTFRWTVPSVTTTTARIKIEALTASGSVLASDMSDADFSIASGTTGGDEDEEDTTPALPTFSDEVDGEPFDGTASGTDALSRDIADAALPLTCPADALVKIPSDNDPETQLDSTVYYVGLDAKRHSFLNDIFFGSWYDDFGDVKTIDPATLASIPLGKPIMVRPGTFWVKTPNDPKTYYVAPNNVLRWITSETAALMLGGTNWNKNVIDLDPSLFSHFTMGDVIDTMVLASGWPRGSLMKTSTSDTVWYVAEDTRRPFTSDAAFSSNRYQDRFIETSDAAGWTSLPLGTPIESQEDGLFSLQH